MTPSILIESSSCLVQVIRWCPADRCLYAQLLLESGQQCRRIGYSGLRWQRHARGRDWPDFLPYASIDPALVAPVVAMPSSVLDHLASNAAGPSQSQVTQNLEANLNPA